MKIGALIRIRDRAAKRQARPSVELIYAYHKSRSPPLLFVPSLRIEGDYNKVALRWGIRRHYQTSFP